MLDDNEIKSLEKYFGKVAAAQGIEVPAVIDMFNESLELVESAPSLAGKSRRAVLKRAKATLTGILNNRSQPGEPFVFIPFGPLGDPRDWNNVIFQTISAEVDRGNIKGLAADGKLMCREVDGKLKPVTEIEEFEIKKRFVDLKTEKVYDEQNEKETRAPMNELIVTKGPLWEKGLPLLFRDNRNVMNGRINFGATKELQHRWDVHLVGLAFPKENPEDVRLLETHLKYDQADPRDDNFLFNNMEMFKPYVANFEIDVKKSQSWRYVLTAKRISAKATELDLEDGLDAAIEDLFAHLHETYDAEANKVMVGKSTDTLPDFLDGFSELKEYHLGIDEDGMESELYDGAVKTIKGKIETSAKGWDKMKWNKYAIMVVDVSELKEPSRPGGSYMYFLSDSTVNHRMTAWASLFIKEQPKPIPGTCIMLVRTRRGPNRYDRVARKQIPDPGNGDIGLTIQTIASVVGDDGDYATPTEIGDL